VPDAEAARGKSVKVRGPSVGLKGAVTSRTAGNGPI
jgi:hypothetical protein